MKIFKVDAIDSTNSYMKELLASNKLEDFTVVVANEQFAGRGQQGAVWQSEPGKNLTVSILKKLNGFPVDHSFDLSMMVSLSVLNLLRSLEIPEITVKWPNDIMSGNAKVCGVLLQNVLQGAVIKETIIGIGLNVNQKSFENLPNAASLKMLSGRIFDLDLLLRELLRELQDVFTGFKKKDREKLKETYENALFKRNVPVTFELGDGSLLMGIVQGVMPDGRLSVLHENGALGTYGLKEIRMRY